MNEPTPSARSGSSPVRLLAALPLALPVALSAALMVTAAAGEPWRGRLQGGGEVWVDPETHRAMGGFDGVERPLWDGVHRLEDGSTVIIRDGIAVPTEPMYEAWRRAERPRPVLAERYCEQLVRKTCGFDDACSSTAACVRARSLRTDAARERHQGRSAAQPPTAAVERCRQALDDPAFPVCASIESDRGDSRCRALVVKVCGANDACAETQACDAARQLQALETEERLVREDPRAPGVTGRQCLEAMHNDFFTPCEPAGPAPRQAGGASNRD